jgi:hypothetical protein
MQSWKEDILNGRHFTVVLSPNSPNMGTIRGGETYMCHYHEGGFTCSGYNLAARGNHTATYSNANPTQNRISVWGRVFSYNNDGEVFDAQHGLVGTLRRK